MPTLISSPLSSLPKPPTKVANLSPSGGPCGLAVTQLLAIKLSHLLHSWLGGHLDYRLLVRRRSSTLFSAVVWVGWESAKKSSHSHVTGREVWTLYAREGNTRCWGSDRVVMFEMGIFGCWWFFPVLLGFKKVRNDLSWLMFYLFRFKINYIQFNPV